MDINRIQHSVQRGKTSCFYKINDPHSTSNISSSIPRTRHGQRLPKTSETGAIQGRCAVVGNGKLLLRPKPFEKLPKAKVPERLEGRYMFQVYKQLLAKTYI